MLAQNRQFCYHVRIFVPQLHDGHARRAPELNQETFDLRIMKAAVLALCLCAAPRLASAQQVQWTDKGYATLDAGAQVGSHTLNTSSTFPLYDENATVTSSQKVLGGGFFDIGGAYRVWKNNLLGGITFVHTASDSSVTIQGQIPDPAVFNQPRSVTSSASGAKHSENVVHLDAIWMIPLIDKVDIGVFAGPSIFSMSQDTISTLTVTEPAPTVSAPLTRVKKTRVGLNLGADVQYMFTKRWGVGGVARYSWASATVASTGKLTLGGFQIGVGGRMRF